MKLEVLSTIMHDGETYNAGDKMIVDAEIAQTLIDAGAARQESEVTSEQAEEPQETTEEVVGGPTNETEEVEEKKTKKSKKGA